jgi:hypothetical protein
LARIASFQPLTTPGDMLFSVNGLVVSQVWSLGVERFTVCSDWS